MNILARFHQYDSGAFTKIYDAITDVKEAVYINSKQIASAANEKIRETLEKVNYLASIVFTALKSAQNNFVRVLTNARNNISSGLMTLKNNIIDFFTISVEKKIRLDNLIKKIAKFIYSHKSYSFFALSILATYYFAPITSLSYFSKFMTISIKSSFVYGALIGSVLFALRSLYTSKKIRTSKDENINNLLAIANICQTYLHPQMALIYSVAMCGFVTIKTFYNLAFCSSLKTAESIDADPIYAFFVPAEHDKK
jgi:hypothetical protein